MSAPPARTPARFQFTIRFVLVVITAACLMLGVIEWQAPDDIPLAVKIVTYGMILAVLLFAAWTYLRRQQNP